MSTENTKQDTQTLDNEDGQTLIDLLHLTGKGRGFYLKDVADMAVEVDLSLNGSIEKEYEDFKTVTRKLFAKILQVDPAVIQYFKDHEGWQSLEKQLAEEEEQSEDNKIDNVIAYDTILTSVLVELTHITEVITGLDKHKAIVNIANKLEDISAFVTLSESLQQQGIKTEEIADAE